MAFETYTKDCTALSDAELTEMADLAAEGYSYPTLERIGGTPAVLLGLAYVRRSEDRDDVLETVMSANYHRALMAFPDEDVLLGCRMVNPAAMSAFERLADIHPRPDASSSTSPATARFRRASTSNPWTRQPSTPRWPNCSPTPTPRPATR